MSGKATMTAIGNGLAVYDNGAGVRGVVNMSSPSVGVMRDTVRVGADVAGNAQNVYGATQVAQSNDLAKAGSQFGLSVGVGALFGGVPGLFVGAAFDLVAFKNENGLGLGLLEPNPKANLNYAHEFNFVGSPYYDNSNTKTPTQTNLNYSNEGRNYQKPSNGLTPNKSAVVSNAAANAAQITKTAQAAAQAAAKHNAAQEAKYAAIGGDYYTPGEPISIPDDYDSYASERNSGSSSTPSYDSFESDWSAATGGFFPIVIDLDGDGVEIRPLSSSATFFDTDSDSYQERTAWAGADDGILVIDLDGDGQVTQAKEIAFAEWTEEQDSDLQALAKVFDSNQDGVFDSQDERFAEFRIWKDANSNGVVDAGEMMTLQEAGIESMSLKTKDGTAVDLSGVCAANDRLFCLRA